MDFVQLCEIGMLLAFGFSWPFNIYKSWKSRTAKGKSILFEVVVVIGYTIGLTGKFIAYANTGVLAYSVWFYIADIVMVLIDAALYVRNVQLDRRAEEYEREMDRIAA
ncbi:MAG: hypothetical protein ACOYJJ_08590 [Anaerovoracaceae bacterium]|jgi:uncharacterized membrane protein (DUF485 family)